MDNKERKWIKQQLDKDVESIRFTEEMQTAVLSKATTHTPLWNREIQLRLPKSVVAFTLIILIGMTAMLPFGLPTGTEHQAAKEQLVYLSTGVYSKSILRQLDM